MKLFVIVISEIYKDQELQNKPVVRLTKEDARGELKALYKKGCEEYPGWIAEKADDAFSIYADGEHCESHFDAEIHEVEVDGIRAV